MLLPVNQRSPAWYAARQGKITASTAAAILGVDPHHGPLWAYNAILGLHSQKPNVMMDYGIAHEVDALAAYEVLSGNLVERTGFWIHDDLKWLGASPDGLVGAEGLCEVKCPAHIPEALPEQHRIQIVVQLACTNRQWCDYMAWCHDRDGLLCHVDRDLTVEHDVLHRLGLFYEMHVLPKQPPPRRKPTVPESQEEPQ